MRRIRLDLINRSYSLPPRIRYILIESLSLPHLYVSVGTKWLIRETRQVEDCSQDDFIYSTRPIYKIFTRRTHCRYTSDSTRFSNESCHVVHDGTFFSTRLFTFTAVKRSAESPAGQLACWCADSHVITRVDFSTIYGSLAVKRCWSGDVQVSIDAMNRVSRLTSADP